MTDEQKINYAVSQIKTLPFDVLEKLLIRVLYKVRGKLPTEVDLAWIMYSRETIKTGRLTQQERLAIADAILEKIKETAVPA